MKFKGLLKNYCVSGLDEGTELQEIRRRRIFSQSYGASHAIQDHYAAT